MSKIVVVGSGFSGSVLARKIAEELDRKVTVIERRNHIAGNAYDEYDKYGILIQKYGPHFIYTDNYKIIKYLNQYSDLFRHDTKILSYIDNNYVRLPYNFLSLRQLIGEEKAEPLLAKMRHVYKGRDRVSIYELLESNDIDIREYADFLFEKAFRTYMAKMWGINPSDIDKSVLDRVPMAMSYDERYTNKDFQYLPINGFTSLFESLLDHKNINIELDVDALDGISLDTQSNRVKYKDEDVELLIFTGAADELFNLKYGRLPYRALDFKYEYFNQESVMPCGIVSYPQAEGYTRKTEYKEMMHTKPEIDVSVVVTEYPLPYNPKAEKGNEPYYPVLTEESQTMYKKYLDESKKYSNLILCGRLADFKYYNMDACIENAFQKFEIVKQRLSTT